MSETGTARTAADAEPDAALAAAVAGIAGIVPQAPEDLLAPRLRTPFFAACIALALAAHVAGLVAYVALRLDEGLGGRLADGAGVNVIEVDIIDGEDAVLKGGRTEEASPGAPSPFAPSAVEQAASAAQPSVVTERERADEQQPPPSTDKIAALVTETPDASDALPQIPPPPFAVDTSRAPVADVEREPAATTNDVPKEAPAETAESAVSSEAVPEMQDFRESLGGEGGQAQAVTETSGNGGTPVATPGQIKTYHARLGAHIKSHRPVSRGRWGKVVVRFRLDADGVLQAANVVQSSGNAQLEERTLAALHKASPYPKPPAGMHGKQLEFTVPFTFYQ